MTPAEMTLDHRGPERAGVEVAETFVHHGGALGEVGSESLTTGVGDAHARWHHIVGHARKLVDAMHGEMLAFASQRLANFIEHVERHWADARPRDVGQQAEHTVEVQRTWFGKPMRQQMQAQIDVGSVARCDARIDLGYHWRYLDTTSLVDCVRCEIRALCGWARITPAESAIVHVEHHATRRHRRRADTPSTGRVAG